MDAKVLDATGWPIVPEARIRITYRTGAKREGVVVKIVEAAGKPAVEARDFKTHGLIYASPEDCRVMRGQTKNQVRYEREAAAVRAVRCGARWRK